MTKFEWGSFILAPRRGRGTGRFSMGRGYSDGSGGTDNGHGRDRGRNHMRGGGFAGTTHWNNKYTNPGFDSRHGS